MVLAVTLIGILMLISSCQHSGQVVTQGQQRNIEPSLAETSNDTKGSVSGEAISFDSKNDELQMQMDNLRRRIQSRDLNGAEKLCYQILEKTRGQNGFCWNVLGVIAAVQKQTYKAEYCWKKAEEFGFNSVVLSNNRGYLWMNQKEWDLALLNFKNSLESNKTKAALLGLAYLYAQFKLYEKARFILTELPPSQVQSASEGNILGILAMSNGELALAKDYFEKALVMASNQKIVTINYSILAVDFLKDKTLGQRLLDSWAQLGVESTEESEFRRLKTALEKL